MVNDGIDVVAPVEFAADVTNVSSQTGIDTVAANCLNANNGIVDSFQVGTIQVSLPFNTDKILIGWFLIRASKWPLLLQDLLFFLGVGIRSRSRLLLGRFLLLLSLDQVIL